MSYDINGKLMSGVCPCLKCKEPIRHIGCHADCPVYLNWKEVYTQVMREHKNKVKTNWLCKPDRPVRRRKRK